ncbi:MAG: hypothetical protein K6G56_05185 [Clostridiales bacterium]|nr:hypothetical protein [Clostridiales bacterium]
MDSIAFSAAVSRALLRKSAGIGMLGEKTLHSALKYYYEPDETRHEIEFSGFFADVKNEDGVIEIQTRSLSSLKRKLAAYLPLTAVTVVHPVVRRRRLIYLDEETGELSKPRLSPKTGSVYDAFWELIRIREFLPDPNLMVVIPVVDADEYRTRTEPTRGFKKRRGKSLTKYELVPTELVEERVFVCGEDWLRLIPPPLLEKDGFTAAELSRSLKISEDDARVVCRTLFEAAALKRERVGHGYVYRAASGPKEAE